MSVSALHFVYLLRESVGPWADWFLLIRPGVESFFVLSGYFLAASYRDQPTDVHFSVRRLVTRRLLRLLVPFWVAVGMVYLLPVWRAFVPAADPPFIPPALTDVLANLACVSDLTDRPLALFTFWSLASLIQLHVVWAATFWLVRWAFLWGADGRHHPRTLGVMQTLCLVATAGSWWTAFAPNAEPMDWRLAGWFVYAGLGAAAYWAVRNPVWRWVVAALGVALIGGAALAASPRPVLGLVCTAALLFVAVRPRFFRGWLVRGVATIGEWSYSVYLVHGIVGYRAMTAVGWFGLPADGWGGVVVFAVGLTASVVGGWAFFRLVERPVLRLARGIHYRGEDAPAREHSRAAA